MTQLQRILPDADLSGAVAVLRSAHGTVAQQFGFTQETNPTNSAFIDAETLRGQLEKGIELYLMIEEGNAVGCIAIEESQTEVETFYIEKVSVVPDFRNRGLGMELMNFAASLIKERGGKHIGIALINEYEKLKAWYQRQGFREILVKEYPHLPFNVCFMSKEI
ncbi:GNAT family N-acetyltransferase [Paludibacter jiangxiensis]|uniref:Acetyltransferase (GNAT) domain-containing protein n=1 Tax=Paludibacter jiangxiensis TaxID=681398 RepID=A0A171AGW5_9BACT|nr:GNAT family N-acetyltransferase [Paludibacter jiangxiensis]GAT63709.1 acetyltransferase (GNAT) domain-containing protein [Paludibacter jiangxiensis]